MKTLLVIPCYNHSKYLPDLLKKIRKYYNDDILIIDDGSSCSIKIKQSNLDIIRNDFLTIDKDSMLVDGRRTFFTNMPIHRSLSNYFTSLILTCLCNKRIYDSQCGYRRYSLNLFMNSTFEENGYQFESEILLKKINSNTIVNYINIETIYNKSKSHMSHISDTYKFIRCIIRSLF